MIDSLESLYPRIQKLIYENSIIAKPIGKPKKYTLSSIHKTLKKYHPHISLTKNKKIKKIKNKMPKIRYDKNKNILILQFFTYIYNGDTKFYKKYIKYVQKNVSYYLKKKKVKGVIIDLREHEGGWMDPFIMSLSTTILNNSSLFRFVSKREKGGYFNIQKGKIIRGIGKYLGKSLDPKNLKIAILISKKTASSGEVCASIFQRDLSNVKTFGENTKGYLTVNMSYPIDKNYTLHIPILYVESVNKKIHKKEYLTPDVKTKNPMKKAIQWILS